MRGGSGSNATTCCPAPIPSASTRSSSRSASSSSPARRPGRRPGGRWSGSPTPTPTPSTPPARCSPGTRSRRNRRCRRRLQVEFGDLTAHGETSLEREQLAIVVGPPGSGKTRLLQELARRPGADRVLLLRLRDVRDAVGEPEALLRRWLEAAAALAGEPVAIENVLAGQVRIWLLLDALDEVPLERRRAVAEAIEMLSRTFPQHRFTVTSRPVAALADLSPTWRVFDLVCDRRWRSEFLAANEVEEERFWAELAPAGPRLESLLRVPFFLRGAVHLLERGQTVTDAMQIALALLDESLQADDSLAPLGAAPRAWLKRVALLQQLSGGGSIGDEALEALAADQGGLGDLAVLTDLLASRSLLAASSGRWTFTHRLFGEALAAEQLLAEPPEPWLDCVAPETGGWSAVLDQWSATMAMVLFRSAEWRGQVASRDPRFAARATPPDAPGEERLAAASLLWRRAAEWEVWIDPVSTGPATTDAEVIAALDRGGDLDPLLRDVKSGLGAPSRYVRGNAVDVLAAVEPPDAAGLFGEVLADDPDQVVRRAAASAARSLEAERAFPSDPRARARTGGRCRGIHYGHSRDRSHASGAPPGPRPRGWRRGGTSMAGTTGTSPRFRSPTRSPGWSGRRRPSPDRCRCWDAMRRG